MNPAESGNTGPPPGPRRGEGQGVNPDPREIVEVLPNDDILLLPANARRKANVRAMLREHQLLCTVLKPLESAFWRLAQRKAQLEDKLGNACVMPFCHPRTSRRASQREGSCQ